jgi:hypothetical protein
MSCFLFLYCPHLFVHVVNVLYSPSLSLPTQYQLDFLYLPKCIFTLSPSIKHIHHPLCFRIPLCIIHLNYTTLSLPHYLPYYLGCSRSQSLIFAWIILPYLFPITTLIALGVLDHKDSSLLQYTSKCTAAVTVIIFYKDCHNLKIVVCQLWLP